MTNNANQNLIAITEEEFRAIAHFFLTAIAPSDAIQNLAYCEAGYAVHMIAERVVNGAMAENGVSLAMEPVSEQAAPANIIQLPSSKKW